MKFIRATIGLSVLLLLMTSTLPAQGDFNIFFRQFKKAVLKNDRQTIKARMASRFEWADGAYTGREAFSFMEENDFADLRRTVLRNRPRSCEAVWSNVKGICMDSGPEATYVWMFARERGVWKLFALIGD